MNPRCLSLCLALSLLTVPAWATPEDAVAYANTLAFTDKADRLRSAFDRWDRIVRENTFLEENVYKRGFLYGYQFDLAPNIGALGLAYGQKRLRFYGLGYTTELQAWTRDDYQRAAGGLNVNFDWVQLQAEANAGDGGLFYFGKVSSAPLQTACTIALDPFEETNTDGLVLAGGGSAKPNRFGCETSIIPGVSRLGTDVDVVLNYVKPSLTISLSGILNVVSADEDVLGKTPFDVELRLSSRMKEMDDFSDFTAILTLYLVKEGSFLKSKGLGIANRAVAFVSGAYRTGNLLADRLRTEGVQDVGDPKGFGVEGGIGLRVFGLAAHGFPTSDYVKLVGYYNFPDYHDIYPQMQAGGRLQINY